MGAIRGLFDAISSFKAQAGMARTQKQIARANAEQAYRQTNPDNMKHAYPLNTQGD